MNFEKMKHLREQKAMTQRQLADDVMVAQSMIAQVEAGYKEPSIALLERIANVLGVQAAELL